MKDAEKKENLRLAVKIIESHNCKWWLEAGTCLGAIREKTFIAHDTDIDIGLTANHLDLWDTFIKDFKEAGFYLYKEWSNDGKNIELSFTKDEVKLDLFFFFEKGDFLWHGAFWRQEFLPHTFSKTLFDDLKKIDFEGMKCFVPNPPERYLIERYGKNWKTPNSQYRYYDDCRAIDRAFFKEVKIVFIGGAWDLFHIGHLNILKKAKTLGTILIVGVLTDEAAANYKERPIIPFVERFEIIESLKFVDKAIKQNSREPMWDFQRLKIKPHYIVHGDDWDYCPSEEYVRTFGGKVVFFPYTKNRSTTLIKDKIVKERKVRDETSI